MTLLFEQARKNIYIQGMEKAHTIANVCEGSKPYVLSEILEQSDSAVVYITYNEPHMEQVAKVLPFFVDKAVEILTFPGWDCLPYDKVSVNSAVMNRRISTLAQLTHTTSRRILLTTVSAILQKLPPKSVIQSAYLQLNKGETIERDALVDFLVSNGYSRLGKVVDVGEFSVRGSIVDLFPPASENAYRLDFFGDTLENIRTFDPMTQISHNTVEAITLLPTSEIILKQENIERFRSGYRELFGTAKKDDALYHAISEGRKHQGMEHWLPLFYDGLDTVFDYIANAQVVLDTHTQTAIHERLRSIQEYYEARLSAQSLNKKLLEDVEIYNPLSPERLYLTDEAIAQACMGALQI